MFTLTDSQKIVKTCTKCGETKPVSAFYKAAHGRFGVKGKCKVCMNSEYRAWRLNGGNKLVNLNNLKYYKQNKHTVEYRYLRLKTGAKQRGKEIKITLDEFKTMWNDPCFYCGDLVTTAGIDRVDSSKGYIKGNIVRCCEICNRAKNDMSAQEFIEHCRKVVRHATN